MSYSQLQRTQEEDQLKGGKVEQKREQLSPDNRDDRHEVNVEEMHRSFKEAVFASPLPRNPEDVVTENLNSQEKTQTSPSSSSSQYKSVSQQKHESAAAQLGAQLKFIIEKIISKLQKPVDSLGRAKLIVRYVRQLKAISADDASINIVSSVLVNHNTLGYLMVSYQKLLRYPLLTDETLRCILPIVRQKSTLKNKLLHQLVDHGSAIFALNALRHFDQEQSIKVQALELLSSSIDFMIDPEAESPVAVSDLIHQLILNGSTTTLPALLTYYSETRNEVSTRRAINCTSFMIRSSPQELTLTLVTVNNWAIVRALCISIHHFSRIAQVESAELMIGLIACSPVSGDKLCHFGGLDEMCRVIVENASNLKIHTAWLKKAVTNMKSILALAVGAKRNAIERFIKALTDLYRIGTLSNFQILSLNLTSCTLSQFSRHYIHLSKNAAGSK